MTRLKTWLSPGKEKRTNKKLYTNYIMAYGTAQCLRGANRQCKKLLVFFTVCPYGSRKKMEPSTKTLHIETWSLQNQRGLTNWCSLQEQSYIVWNYNEGFSSFIWCTAKILGHWNTWKPKIQPMTHSHSKEWEPILWMFCVRQSITV